VLPSVVKLVVLYVLNPRLHPGTPRSMADEAAIVPRPNRLALIKCILPDCILSMRCCILAFSRVSEPGSRHRDTSKWPDQMKNPGGAATPRRFGGVVCLRVLRRFGGGCLVKTWRRGGFSQSPGLLNIASLSIPGARLHSMLLILEVGSWGTCSRGSMPCARCITGSPGPIRGFLLHPPCRPPGWQCSSPFLGS
jgi:hypothetical protein